MKNVPDQATRPQAPNGAGRGSAAEPDGWEPVRLSDPLESDADQSVAMANAAVAAAVVGALVEAGARHAVVSPGSRNTPLTLALERSDLQLHVVVDERSAGFVALGLARQSARPVVLSCTSGSAGAHWHPALVEAHACHLPLVAITANRPADLHGCGAPQTVPQSGLFAPHVVADQALPAPTTPDDARAFGRATGQLVAQTAMGPVHLDLAFRKPLWSSEVPEPAAVRPTRRIPVVRTPDPRAVSALLELRGRRGVLVCGPDAVRNDTEAAAARRFCQTWGWPLLADIASGVARVAPALAFPEIVLTADQTLRRSLQPEVVVQLGRWPTSRALAQLTGDVHVLVNEHGAWHDPTDRASLFIDAPVGALLTAAADAVDLGHAPADTLAPPADWPGRWQTLDDAAADALGTDSAGGADGWFEGAIIRAALSSAGSGPVHIASSMAIRDADIFGGRVDARPTSNRGANGIDGTVATALGLALGANQPTLVILGDVAAVHDMGGFLAARELLSAADAPALVALVLDNGGGNIFRKLPVRSHPEFERLFVTRPVGALEEALMPWGRLVRVATREAVAEAVSTGLAGQGLTVVLAVVDAERGNARRDHTLTLARRAVARAGRTTPEVRS